VPDPTWTAAPAHLSAFADISVMELDVCIRGRRSVRAYRDEAVPKEKIEAVLEAGTWAPTGMDRQPWKFIVIEDKGLIRYVSDETKKVVREMMPQMAKSMDTDKDVICYGAPALILVCAQADKMWGQVNLLDSVLAAQNMFLKAHELGLGTCYMGFVAFLSSKPDVVRKMGVPEGHELMVPFILGIPKAKPGAGKRRKPDIIKWVK
jgi:nitroreductase